jgi:hypothetical protein
MCRAFVSRSDGPEMGSVANQKNHCLKTSKKRKMKKRIYRTPAACVAYIHSEATMLSTSTGEENYAIHTGADADTWKTPVELGEYGGGNSSDGDVYFENWN